MTFLSMLLTSLLMSRRRGGEMRRCVRFIPSKAWLMLGNDAIDYCADLSALISRYDLRDGWEDERQRGQVSPKARCSKRQNARGQCAPRQKREAVERYVARLHEVERRNDMNLDAAANLSGEMLGERLEKGRLRAGFCANWAFTSANSSICATAFEDVEQDIKKKLNYNPPRRAV